VTLETRCGNTAGFFLFILAKVGFAKVGFAKVGFANSVSARKQALVRGKKSAKR
jgi:hypothetical protein